mmetsp:Transcript_35095/g.81155  ORF Transcript_35095/g.81155 Transcript_35095/m.81155 type:complete len:278 (-) Transcript_35095:2778-3611(-)
MEMDDKASAWGRLQARIFRVMSTTTSDGMALAGPTGGTGTCEYENGVVSTPLSVSASNRNSAPASCCTIIEAVLCWFSELKVRPTDCFRKSGSRFDREEPAFLILTTSSSSLLSLRTVPFISSSTSTSEEESRRSTMTPSSCCCCCWSGCSDEDEDGARTTLDLDRVTIPLNHARAGPIIELSFWLTAPLLDVADVSVPPPPPWLIFLLEELLLFFAVILFVVVDDNNIPVPPLPVTFSPTNTPDPALLLTQTVAPDPENTPPTMAVPTIAPLPPDP